MGCGRRIPHSGGLFFCGCLSPSQARLDLQLRFFFFGSAIPFGMSYDEKVILVGNPMESEYIALHYYLQQSQKASASNGTKKKWQNEQK